MEQNSDFTKQQHKSWSLKFVYNKVHWNCLLYVRVPFPPTVSNLNLVDPLRYKYKRKLRSVSTTEEAQIAGWYHNWNGNDMAVKKAQGSVWEWGKWERLGKEEMGLQVGSLPGTLNAGKMEEARWEGRPAGNPMPH